MAATSGLDLREAVVFLAAVGLVVPVMHRLRLSTILGFLLVGLVLGPFGLGRLASHVPMLGYLVVDNLAGVHLFAELGVVMLLFMIGLELSPERLWAMRRLVFGLGASQVVVSGVVIGVIAWGFGNSTEAALILGACLALSSTAVVMQILTERGRLGTPVGRASFAVLLFQDLAVVPVLFLVGIVGTPGTEGVLGELALALGKAALALASILIVGRLVFRPLLRRVAATGSRELFLAVVLLVIIGAAAATEFAGLSLALGAFLAGLLLAETAYRHQIAVDLEPFKGLLLGVFFTSVGLGIDTLEILAEPVLLPLSVLGLIAIKATVLYGLARLWGEPHEVAVEMSVLLGQAGEFAFIVIGLAGGLGALPPDTAQFMLLVTGLGIAVTPLLALLGRHLGGRRGRQSAQAMQPDELPDLVDHVVIAGFGRVGRMIAAMLDGQRIPHVAIDAHADVVAALRAEGRAAFWGNAAHPDILGRLGIDRALALVVTMNDADATADVVRAARAHWPNLPIFARARDADHARMLIGCGATDVVPETVEASLQLSEAVLIGTGVPDEAARQIVADEREAQSAHLRST